MMSSSKLMYALAGLAREVRISVEQKNEAIQTAEGLLEEFLVDYNIHGPTEAACTLAHKLSLRGKG